MWFCCYWQDLGKQDGPKESDWGAGSRAEEKREVGGREEEKKQQEKKCWSVSCKLNEIEFNPKGFLGTVFKWEITCWHTKTKPNTMVIFAFNSPLTNSTVPVSSYLTNGHMYLIWTLLLVAFKILSLYLPSPLNFLARAACPLSLLYTSMLADAKTTSTRFSLRVWLLPAMFIDVLTVRTLPPGNYFGKVPEQPNQLHLIEVDETGWAGEKRFYEVTEGGTCTGIWPVEKKLAPGSVLEEKAKSNKEDEREKNGG